MKTVKNPLSGLALALCCCALARAQISPGPLSRAHQHLEGLTRCASCHDVGGGARGLKCLECHAEIKRRVEAKTGFHARAYKSAAGETDCRRCHKEHHGLANQLVRLELPNFDHLAQTGYALAGKHRQQKCQSCHTAAKIPADARREIKVRDLNRSFLGLRRECLACHKDQHQGQLDKDCLRCHTQDAFKPAPGFNHAATHFPLTGLHQKSPCQKCHGPRPGQEAVKFKGLPHNGCQDCHNDPHRGAFQEARFQGSCNNCHNTNGWKNNRPGAEFNHAATKFALTGKHKTVLCSACHKSADFKRPIAFERCRDCHKDPHDGQFAARAAGSDCAACHNDTGFKPARFDREMHSKSAFPLEGKHASLRCTECHKPEGPKAVYISRKLVCSACHADRHRGEFAAAPHANRCERCHTLAGFRAPTFSVARHGETQFALTGKHASVQCEKCHKPLEPGGAATELASIASPAPLGAPRQYRFANRTCNACHRDPHQTQKACESCHNTGQWKAVRPFDHSAGKFRIEGAHLNVKCVQCHKPLGPAAGATAALVPAFFKTPIQCFECHGAKDAHAGQFRIGSPEEDCSACHVMERWKGEDFNHDKTRFALNRVHRNVDCAKCHKEQQKAGLKLVRMYRGTPIECIKCH